VCSIYTYISVASQWCLHTNDLKFVFYCQVWREKRWNFIFFRVVFLECSLLNWCVDTFTRYFPLWQSQMWTHPIYVSLFFPFFALFYLFFLLFVFVYMAFRWNKVSLLSREWLFPRRSHRLQDPVYRPFRALLALFVLPSVILCSICVVVVAKRGF